MSSRGPPLLQARISDEIGDGPLDLAPRRRREHAVAMREIHCLKVLKEPLKKALNLTFETGSRSWKDWRPRRKIAQNSPLS
jgi:hypothetical protein